MNEIVILGILVRDEMTDVAAFQHLLTKHGNVIRTRLGLHDNFYGIPEIKGLLLLELSGDPTEMAAFENGVAKIHGMEVQKMHFNI